MYRGKISKYVFLLSAVIVGSIFWRCVEVPTNAPELPTYLQDNQIRFVNALSVMKTSLNEEDPDTIDALPSDTLVLSISAIDTTFLYDTTEVEVADTATYFAQYNFLDSLQHDTLAIEIINGVPDTLIDSNWYTYRFFTDTTVTGIDSTIDTTAYMPNGALQVIDRFFREDSAVVSSIDLSVGEGGTSVTGIGFGSASNYMANWPVGGNDLVLTAYSQNTEYRRITKRDSALYALSVYDSASFYGVPGADGFAEGAEQVVVDTTLLMDIAVGTSQGDTLTDSLRVTFPSDRKATILLHAPKSDGSKITLYTDNYISSGPVDVDENADFALLRVINATTPNASADVSVVAGNDTTALAVGGENLGFTNNTGYVKFENVGTKTLLADIGYQMFDTAGEEYVDATANLAEEITLEANKRYTAFIFQDGDTFSIAVMVDDE